MIFHLLGVASFVIVKALKPTFLTAFAQYYQN